MGDRFALDVDANALRRAIAVCAAVTMLLAGCSAETRQDDPRDAAIAEVLADGHVEIDLADPPERSDLALIDDASEVFLEKPDFERFKVTLTFSDGQVLEVDDVKVLGVQTNAAGQVDGATIGLREFGFDEIERRLLDSVERFGVDATRVNSYLRSAGQTKQLGRMVQVSLPAEGITAPEFLEVQPVVHEDDDEHVLNYLVEWDPEA